MMVNKYIDQSCCIDYQLKGYLLVYIDFITIFLFFMPH